MNELEDDELLASSQGYVAGAQTHYFTPVNATANDQNNNSPSYDSHLGDFYSNTLVPKNKIEDNKIARGNIANKSEQELEDVLRDEKKQINIESNESFNFKAMIDKAKK